LCSRDAQKPEAIHIKSDKRPPCVGLFVLSAPLSGLPAYLGRVSIAKPRVYCGARRHMRLAISKNNQPPIAMPTGL
jgi:hypothetical protein